MANIAEEFELGEIALILILIAAIGYGIYYVVTNGFCSIFGTCDQPCSGGPGVTCTDKNGNFQTNPISYSDALKTTLSSPVATLKSIFGID